MEIRLKGQEIEKIQKNSKIRVLSKIFLPLKTKTQNKCDYIYLNFGEGEAFLIFHKTILYYTLWQYNRNESQVQVSNNFGLLIW